MDGYSVISVVVIATMGLTTLLAAIDLVVQVMGLRHSTPRYVDFVDVEWRRIEEPPKPVDAGGPRLAPGAAASPVRPRAGRPVGAAAYAAQARQPVVQRGTHTDHYACRSHPPLTAPPSFRHPHAAYWDYANPARYV